MRLVSFALPHDPVPRTGVLAHDGARVVDLTEIGVRTFAEGAARAGELARVASHLLHMPGAVAHLPSAVRYLAPASRLAAVYDAATLRPAVALAAGAASTATPAPLGPESAVPIADGLALGLGVACVVGRAAHDVAAADVEPFVAGLALVACWRDGPGRVEAAVLGPWLVTLDEFAGPRAAPLAVPLEAAVAVNGAPARGGSWAALTAKLAAALSDASRRAPLAPGDAVAVATFEVARDADLADPAAIAPPGAAPGDEVLLEATRLGALRSFVAPPRDAVAAAS